MPARRRRQATPIGDKQANRRIRLLLALFTIAFAAMFARAFWLQAVQAAHLGSVAVSQHEATQRIPAGRGTIFDRTGIELAIDEQRTTVFADPQLLRNPRGIARAAQQLLGVNGSALYQQLLDRRSQFVYVQRFADPTAAARLREAVKVG